MIELLEKKPAGIFPCLDGQCKMPKATDLTFAASLHKARQLVKTCHTPGATTAPHAPRPVAPRAQAAPTHPRAPPQHLGGLPWPQELASGRPKVEDAPLSRRQAHREQPHFSTLSQAHLKGVSLRDEECFVVHHYAADVCYTAAGFLEKNADALSPEFEAKLKNSANSFVRQLVTGATATPGAAGGADGRLTKRGPGNNTRRKSGGNPPEKGGPQQTSVGAKFLKGLSQVRSRSISPPPPWPPLRPRCASLYRLASPATPRAISPDLPPGSSQLMREIATTHPYFVRCIKPNQLLKPGVFNAAMILRQLQCSGTIECVKLMQAYA